MLTCGRLGPCPAHQVGLSDWRLGSIHFAMKPPYPHGVVIRTGSNLPAKQGGLYRDEFSVSAYQNSSASKQWKTSTGFANSKQDSENYHGCSCNGLKLETKKVKSWLPYLCEICWTPRNRGYFLTVALQHHGGMCRVRNLWCKIRFKL